jgi:hypothetical protein
MAPWLNATGSDPASRMAHTRRYFILQFSSYIRTLTPRVYVEHVSSEDYAEKGWIWVDVKRIALFRSDIKHKAN